MRVAIYHNILWSKYKGVVFSQVHASSQTRGIVATFIQIAETEDMRLALGGVDLSYHQYPFRLLFRGAYTSTPLIQRVTALLKDLYKNPCDLVVIPGYHRTEYWAMLLGCIVLRRRRAVFCDSTYPDRPRVLWKDMAKRWFFQLCDGFFCYGIRSKEYLMSYGVNEARINYRCQVAALPRDYSAANVLRDYEENSQAGQPGPRFLYVGRLAQEKGLYDLLDAFRQFHAGSPQARLEFVGGGPLAEQLKARVAEINMQDSVAFLGSKSLEEIAPLLMRSTALVLPSHSEPWGLVVNESLSFGCPVVVSNACGCVPDLVINGVTGYWFDAANVAALLAALKSVTRLSIDRAGVARRCLEVISEFTPERAAAQILDGCVRIIGQTP
jgi:glycosyltransferase involved in cell wall biosynthesis